jgi:hypothetical protein
MVVRVRGDLKPLLFRAEKHAIIRLLHGGIRKSDHDEFGIARLAGIDLDEHHLGVDSL